jgi:putative spermidine/putrescine transport system ATP-binding protein
VTKLVLDGLKKLFGAVHAIKDLHLSIGEGEFISLLGPSGCGKTTTLRCIAGFEYPDEGRIFFDSQDVTDEPPERRDLGMVFQNYALFPHLTVFQNLAFGLEMRKVKREDAKKRIDQVLGMVQLTAMLDRYPRQLSGGQQQRVALARALVIEPRILLLDEPLANLDAILREEMRFFIRDLQKRVGITTVYVTHDQAEAMVMSDRIAVMFDGGVAQLGAPAEIYDRPRTRRVASFIGRSNFIAGTVEAPTERGLWRVATAVGPFIAASTASLTAGSKVTIAIRPEALHLTTEAGSGRLPCRVEQAYFLGNAVDHITRLADNTRILVQASPNRKVAPDSDAFLAVDPGQAWILAEEP